MIVWSEYSLVEYLLKGISLKFEETFLVIIDARKGGGGTSEREGNDSNIFLLSNS